MNCPQYNTPKYIVKIKMLVNLGQQYVSIQPRPDVRPTVLSSATIYFRSPLARFCMYFDFFFSDYLSDATNDQNGLYNL